MTRSQASGTIELAPELRVLSSRTSLPCLSEPQILYLLLEVKAPSESGMLGMPLNLCLVVDRSTSMRGERLEALKQAAGRLIDSLGEEDIFSMVAFSDRGEVVIPSECPVNRSSCRSRLSTLQAGGGTEILQGLKLGLREVRANRRPEMINHIILLTDGQTYGDEAGCLLLAEEARSEDIGISTLGIGDDWNDVFLDALAGRTGGISQFVESTGKLTHFLDGQVRGLMETRSQPLRVHMRMAEGAELLSAFRLEPEPQWLEHTGETLMLGPVPQDQPARVLLEALLSPRPVGQHSLFRLHASTGLFASKQVDVTLPCVAVELPEPVLPAIVEAARALTLYRMHELACQDASGGNLDKATERLSNLAMQLASNGQAELAQTARREARRLATEGRMSKMATKELKFGTRELFRQVRKVRASDPVRAV